MRVFFLFFSCSFDSPFLGVEPDGSGQSWAELGRRMPRRCGSCVSGVHDAREDVSISPGTRDGLGMHGRRSVVDDRSRRVALRPRVLCRTHRDGGASPVFGGPGVSDCGALKQRDLIVGYPLSGQSERGPPPRSIASSRSFPPELRYLLAGQPIASLGRRGWGLINSPCKCEALRADFFFRFCPATHPKLVVAVIPRILFLSVATASLPEHQLFSAD